MRVKAVVVALFVVTIGLAGSYSVTRPKPLEREPLVPTVPPRTVVARLMTVQPTATLFVSATPTPSSTPTASPTASSTGMSAPVTTVQRNSMTATLTSVPPRPSATPTASPVAARAATSWTVPSSDRARIGVGASLQGIDGFDWGDTPPGWYLNWSPVVRPGQWPQIPFLRMVHPLRNEN